MSTPPSAGDDEPATDADGRPRVDVGHVQDGLVQFPAWGAPSDKPTGKPANPLPVSQRVGFAIVGLGRLSLEEILPAFAQTRAAKLSALVSGSPDKLDAVGEQYGIGPTSRYTYADIERLRDDPDVKAVYVVTPNALHEEHVIRAARAGKHVLCEKPMSVDSLSAERMIKACEDASRLLMIAYRSQYEPHMREAIRAARAGEIGRVKLIDALNIENLGDPGQWRLKKALAGGGALPDVGLYCLNIARAITGEEPVEVSATITNPADDARFLEVEDQVSFTLRFPSGAVAQCATGYDGHKLAHLAINGQTGWIEMQSAFEYRGQRLRVARRVGDVEEVAERFPKPQNQFALEIDHMAECVRSGQRPRTPGEEGLQDQRLMEAIYQAAAQARPVRLAPLKGLDATRGLQLA